MGGLWRCLGGADGRGPGGLERPRGKEAMAVMGPPKDEWDSVRGGSGHQKMIKRATDADSTMCCPGNRWATDGAGFRYDFDVLP